VPTSRNMSGVVRSFLASNILWT